MMLCVLQRKRVQLKIIIKNICFALFFLSSIISTVQAKNPPLRIAVTQYSSPFVMQGENQLYGFDIAMMSYICPMIGRDCEYQLMDFDKIIPAITANKVDIGISAITITADRAKEVNFSMPYSASESRFLGKTSLSKVPFNFTLLEKSRRGVKSGTVFIDEINSLGIKNPNIEEFDDEGTMIEALIKGSVDLILVDQPTAMYWQQQASDKLIALGHPITYGYGYGIAVSPAEPVLLKAINQALIQYKTSKEYQNNKFMYLNYF